MRHQDRGAGHDDATCGEDERVHRAAGIAVHCVFTLLWRESEEHDLLRCAIIGTLEQLVRTIRDVPEPMKPFLYSVIELSTDLQVSDFLCLIPYAIHFFFYLFTIRIFT